MEIRTNTDHFQISTKDLKVAHCFQRLKGLNVLTTLSINKVHNFILPQKECIAVVLAHTMHALHDVRGQKCDSCLNYYLLHITYYYINYYHLTIT